jgi:hypothetical protein
LNGSPVEAGVAAGIEAADKSVNGREKVSHLIFDIAETASAANLQFLSALCCRMA